MSSIDSGFNRMFEHSNVFKNSSTRNGEGNRWRYLLQFNSQVERFKNRFVNRKFFDSRWKPKYAKLLRRSSQGAYDNLRFGEQMRNIYVSIHYNEIVTMYKQMLRVTQSDTVTQSRSHHTTDLCIEDNNNKIIKEINRTVFRWSTGCFVCACICVRG